jgi:hypothetical protein
MSFNKPFRAIPINEGRRYRQRRSKTKQPLLTYMGGAALLGGMLGIGSVAMGEGSISSLTESAKPVAVSMGLARERTPQAGDYWSRCAAARQAGTAPIYAGEPGYRDGLDSDSDGIACEPYRGS